METEPIRIHLLGTSFTIRTSEDPGYLQRIVRDVERRFELVSRTMGVSDPLRIAIISSILLADDVKKLQQHSSEAELKTKELIELIDRTVE